MSELLNENVNVEDAPESVSLEELLGLTDVDLGESTSKKVFEVSEKDDIEVEEPHIKIPTKRVSEVLSVSSLVSAAGENSFEGKVVALKVGSEGNVKFMLSDNKRVIERTVPLLNTENYFEGFLVFSSSLIMRLLKVCTSIFTLVEKTVKDEVSGKDKKKYVLRIRGGEISLDAINIPESKFTYDYNVNKKEYNKEPVLSSIKKLYAFASTSIRSGKSIDFNGNIVSTSPINSVAKVRISENLPSFKLSLVDCKILHTLGSIDDGDKLSVSDDGKVFSGNGFNFKTESYPVSTTSFGEVADRMFEGENCEIDDVHLTQITELSCALDTSTGNLRFNYEDDGLVKCTLLTKRENSKIVIQGNRNENVSPMSSDVEVSAYNLKGGLTVFSGDSTLLMRVSSDGVSFESSDTKLAVLGKVVQAK